MACAGSVKYEVKAQKPVLVQPSSSSERHGPYFLTNLDQAVAAQAIEAIVVFDAKNTASRGGVHPAKLLKEALQKVLVHFYPLAGRLRCSPDDGKLFIECNDHGILFVEADTNVDISEIGDFSQPDWTTLRTLVSSLTAMDDPPLLSAQVTRFKCGGFVLGIMFQHCLFDGVAAVEFIGAWGEIVRGVPFSTLPMLDRTFLKSRSPLQISYTHTEYMDIRDTTIETHQGMGEDMITRSFCFTSTSLKIQREKAMEDGVVSKCTVFEALAGVIWRTRTKALWEEYPEQKVKLLIVVDGRSHLKPALPRGYVGNCLVVTCALASSSELQDNPLSYAVKRVQDAIARVSNDYIRSQLDFMELHKLGIPPLGATLGITTWSKLPFNNIDFGWGKPRHVAPVSLLSLATELAIFFPYDPNGKGIDVVLSLPTNAMHRFEEILRAHLNPLSSRL